jgi:hypothetical protein
VTVPLPDRATAPGFRAALSERSGFLVDIDEGSRTARIFPTGPEGALLEPLRVLSPGLDRDRLWEALARFPRYEQGIELKAEALAEAERRANLGTKEGIVSAISLILLVTSNDEIRPRLDADLDAILASFPTMTIWLLTVNPRLLARISLTNILVQQALTPDLPLGRDGEGFRRSLSAHSLTRGVSFADAVQPIFLAFSPAATGFAFPWMPHSLIFEYGGVVDLRTPSPESMPALYESQALGPEIDDLTDRRGRWVNEVPKSRLGALLSWWITRLDTIYTIATDPTRFAGDGGVHEPAGQLAYLLTMERVLVDMTSIGARPQASAPMRLSAAFDLLDKLETLLGYGPPVSGRPVEMRSGKGFERLLNRKETLPVILRGLQTMPLQIRSYFERRAEELYESVYREVGDGVLPSRRRAAGVAVGMDADRVLAWPEYVGQLVRAVRNSSHGLLDQVRGPQFEVAVTHTGALPRLLPELAMMIAFGLLGDPERLWQRTAWTTRPKG